MTGTMCCSLKPTSKYSHSLKITTWLNDHTCKRDDDRHHKQEEWGLERRGVGEGLTKVAVETYYGKALWQMSDPAVLELEPYSSLKVRISQPPLL